MDIQTHLYEEAKRHLSTVTDNETAVRVMALADSMNNAMMQHYSESERESIYQYLISPDLHADAPPRIRQQAAAIAEVLLSIEQCCKQRNLPAESNFPLFPAGLALMVGGFAIVLFLPKLVGPLLSAHTVPMTLAKLYKLVYLGYAIIAVGAFGAIAAVFNWWVVRRSDRHKRFFSKYRR